MFARPKLSKKSTSGVALLTVLMGLSVVTILLSLSINRTASHGKLLSFEARQIKEEARYSGVIEVAAHLAAQREARQSSAEPIDIAIGSVTHQVWLRDITGMIDINTGHLPLLERLFASYDLPAAELVGQLDVLRKGNQRLLNTAELSMLEGINAAQVAELRPFLTVLSGRRGIAPEHSPVELVDRLTGRKGALTGLEGLIPKDWRVKPHGDVYAITIQSEKTQSAAHQTIIQVVSGQRSRVRILRMGLDETPMEDRYENIVTSYNHTREQRTLPIFDSVIKEIDFEKVCGALSKTQCEELVGQKLQQMLAK